MFRRNHNQPVMPPRPAVPPGMARPVPASFPDAERQPAVTVRSAARRLSHRGRHGLRPWLILAGLPPLAAFAHVPYFRYGWPGIIAGAAGAVWISVAAWKRFGDKPWTLYYAIACAWAGGTWLAWASFAGVSRQDALILLCAWFPASCLWWNAHRSRHRHGKEEPPPLPQPDLLLTDLRELVCGPGGKVPGAIVTELPVIEGGRRFKFSLVRGRQTIDTVLSARKDIASAAGISRDRVVTEEMPGSAGGEAGPEHEAMVTILDPRHPQHEIQEFTGPTLDPATGLFDVGPYPDGQMAKARLLKVDEHGNPIRAASGITAGTTGSGKSRHAERKILEHLASGLFQVFLLDGQSGASIPGLAEYVGWAALPPSEWSICLRAVIRLMIARTRLIQARKLPHWDPELGPFLQVFLEEAHRPLGIAANLLAVKTGIQESEKVGIGWDISTQFPSQVELGASSGSPGANVLRDLASSGNVTLFRTGGNFAKSVLVGSVEVAPHLLPQRPGMCHPLGASMRTAPARSIRAADPVSWARGFTAMPFSDLDIKALDGADGAWSGRLERLAAHSTEPDAATLDIGGLDAEADLILGEAIPGQPSRADRAQKTTVNEYVWDILGEHGRTRRADLIEQVRARSGRDFSPSSVDQALAAFERTGHVRKVAGEHGTWERVAKLSVVGGEG